MSAFFGSWVPPGGFALTYPSRPQGMAPTSQVVDYLQPAGAWDTDFQGRKTAWQADWQAQRDALQRTPIWGNVPINPTNPANPANPTNPANPANPANPINNMYMDLFGRNADDEGMAYWSGKSQLYGNDEELRRNMILTASPADRAAYDAKSAASINNMYMDLFGRNADDEGLSYWVGKSPFYGSDAALSEQILLAARPEDRAAYDAKSATTVATPPTQGSPAVPSPGTISSPRQTYQRKIIGYKAPNYSASDAEWNRMMSVFGGEADQMVPRFQSQAIQQSAYDSMAGNGLLNAVLDSRYENPTFGQVSNNAGLSQDTLSMMGRAAPTATTGTYDPLSSSGIFGRR